MGKLAVHFGAGNIGRGFIAPVLQDNGFEVTFVDVDSLLISKLNSVNQYQVSNFLNSKENTLFVENFSGIELDNLDDLELALSKADLITTSVGPNHLLSVINSMVNVEFEKSPVFVAFENKYRASSTAYKEANVELVVVGGKEYGTGSSRDWAAKGTNLLGVKAVICESYERIHRSN